MTEKKQQELLEILSEIKAYVKYGNDPNVMFNNISKSFENVALGIIGPSVPESVLFEREIKKEIMYVPTTYITITFPSEKVGEHYYNKLQCILEDIKLDGVKISLKPAYIDIIKETNKEALEKISEKKKQFWNRFYEIEGYMEALQDEFDVEIYTADIEVIFKESMTVPSSWYTTVQDYQRSQITIRCEIPCEFYQKVLQSLK